MGISKAAVNKSLLASQLQTTMFCDEEEPPAVARPRWRAGSKETTVKVYTIAKEARYLVVSNVPALGDGAELIALFSQYGPIEEFVPVEHVENVKIFRYRLLDEDKAADKFTDVYWIKYCTLSSAREAKRLLNNTPFLGSLLRVYWQQFVCSSTCKIVYALEYESATETHQKLEEHLRSALANTGPHQQSICEQEDISNFEHPPTQALHNPISHESPQMQQSEKSVSATVLAIREKLKSVLESLLCLY